MIRIVCLISGGDEVGGKLPDDLKELKPTLDKVGIQSPRVVAQALVHAAPGAKFQAQGQSSSASFTVGGQFQVKGDANTLSIEITDTPSHDSGPKGFLRTEITAPLGRLIMLGATPNKNTTKVYVVQLLEG